VRRRIGQRLDQLQLLDDGTWPAVRDDHGQGILMFRAHVNEMDVQTVDLREEVGHGVESCLDLPPVVRGCPIVRQFLHGGEGHALREIGDSFLLGQACVLNAPAQLQDVRVRDIHLEWTNVSCLHYFCELRHFGLLRSQ
jgi:hypothetical protein